MAGGGFEGGFVEEAPANAIVSLQEASGCATLFRYDGAAVCGHNSAPQVLAKATLSRRTAEFLAPDCRHTRFSLANGLCAPLRC